MTARQRRHAAIGCAALWLALYMAQPAVATTDCYGCNVVDEGVFDQSLVGQELFYFRYGRKKVKVSSVAGAPGASAPEIEYVTADGKTGRDAAIYFYTLESAKERDIALTGGITLLVGPAAGEPAPAVAEEAALQRCLAACGAEDRGAAHRKRCERECGE